MNVTTTYLRMHDVIAIQPKIQMFNDFTLHSYVATDKFGGKIEVEFFHGKDKPFKILSTLVEDYRFDLKEKGK